MSPPEKVSSPDALPDRAARPRAIRHPVSVVLFTILVVGGLAGDLLSKHHVFASILADPAVHTRFQEGRALGGQKLTPREVLRLVAPERDIGWHVKFKLSTNPGVVFGLPMPRLIVAAATALTIVLVLYFFATTDAGAYWAQSALALILAGALGNLYDRLLARVVLPAAGGVIQHDVRDFIDCSDVPLPFGFQYVWIFNVADILLVIGVGILLVHWLIGSVHRQTVHKSRPAR